MRRGGGRSSFLSEAVPVFASCLGEAEPHNQFSVLLRDNVEFCLNHLPPGTPCSSRARVAPFHSDKFHITAKEFAFISRDTGPGRVQQRGPFLAGIS